MDIYNDWLEHVEECKEEYANGLLASLEENLCMVMMVFENKLLFQDDSSFLHYEVNWTLTKPVTSKLNSM